MGTGKILRAQALAPQAHMSLIAALALAQVACLRIWAYLAFYYDSMHFIKQLRNV